MKKLYTIIIVSGLIIFTLEIYFFRGTFGHFIISNSPLLYIVAPIFIIFLIYNIFRYIKRKSFLSKINNIFFCIFIIFFFNFLSYYAGLALMNKYVNDSKKYCENLIPEIEKYKLEHNFYPKNISDIKRFEKPKNYINKILGSNFYSINTNSYRFDFLDPRGFMTRWGYDKNNRKWYTYD